MLSGQKWGTFFALFFARFQGVLNVGFDRAVREIDFELILARKSHAPTVCFLKFQRN